MTEKEYYVLDEEGEYITEVESGQMWDACGGGSGVPMLVALVNLLINENKELKAENKSLENQLLKIAGLK